MRSFLRQLALVTLGVLPIGLGACASTPSRFYLLNPLPASESIPAPGAAQGPVIGVGPVTLPKYLDRSQIVTRTSGQQLALGEFDRWAEPLSDNVTRVLAVNLARLVPTDHLRLNPWPRSVALDYQVQVEVWQFEGWFGGESTLLALWSLLDEAERPLLTQRAALQIPVGGRDYDAMVQALNQLLGTLSRDIAAAIQRLASRAVKRE
jgi:uncharacterized protein